MKRFLYPAVAVAAFALTAASCRQHTPADDALSHYRSSLERLVEFDGSEAELETLLGEVQDAEEQYRQFKYDERTVAEMDSLSTKVNNIVLEQLDKDAGK